MANIYRLKHSFTAGEVSPDMDARLDFDRYKNGCYRLRNMIVRSQGPTSNRPGYKYIYNLNNIGLDPAVGIVRTIPFIFNEDQSYVMIFYKHIDGTSKVVFAANEGLVVYPDPPPTECPEGTPIDPLPNAGEIVTLTLPDKWDIKAFDWAQTADEMYFAQSGLNPHLIRRHDHYCWELVEISFTDQPDDWSDENGWPETVTFHQQRLVFGANKIRRQTIWMSMAGDFSSFHVDNSNLTDDMAVTFTLDSGTQNKIQWIVSGSALYVGTVGDEWTVRGSTQPALTPKNILAQRQTNMGSIRIRPKIINFTTIYISRFARNVNEFIYDYVYEAYKSNDLTILASHLTTHNSIIDWAYQQVPEQILWCVRDDGIIIALTYQRQHKVVGWHVHETKGIVKTITSIPGDTREDEIWLVVLRIIDGKTYYYLEKMEEFFKSDVPEDSRFLDSFVEHHGDPILIVKGLDHLEGETVSILVNGMVHPERTVTNGQISLQSPYENVIIGLPYISEVWPTVSEIPLRDGTSYTRMGRIVKLNINFHNSGGVFFGRWDSEDGEQEEEIAFRRPWDLSNKPVPLFTGSRSINFIMGYDRDIRYFIRQKQPLPLTVRGVVDIVEVEG